MNKTFAVFANGGTMTTAQTALWQYDYGQILVVQGIELPTAYEVQFCNAGDSTTITSVGDSTGVVIPDQFLQNGETIYAYIYLHTGNADGETEYKITIPVMDRAEPTDIEPTPAQESTIGQLIDALNAGVEAAEEAAEKGPQIIDGYWHIWDAEAGEYVNTNVKAEGEDGADGSNAWMIDVQYTDTVNTTIRAKTEHLIGPPNAKPMYGDVLFVSDGRFGNIFSPGTRITMATLLGDLHGAPGVGVPPSGSTGQVLKKASDADYDTVWANESGGGGTSDYDDLTNKPQIAGVTLSGNKSLADLGIAAASDIPTVPVQSVNGKTGAVVLNASDVGAGTYTKPSGGIPKTDLASAVQTSLGKADTALQSAPVTSVNGQTGAVSLSIPSTASDVGAVASNQGSENAGKVLVVSGLGAVVPGIYNNQVAVNLTITGLDYSGTMDKTPAQLSTAYFAGKHIIAYVPAINMRAELFSVETISGGEDEYEFNFTAVGEFNSQDVIARFTTSSTTSTFTTKIYPLATGQWTGGSY